ncbi:transcription antiterminator LicT [Lentibacillus populi]|uniref:Transcription antiterminator LicT n=1 Tax=Lentibacillus populi TaxID=1827502 RepID=A0A9W5X727_9BACI|nr:PRD domain-containing protein [Lentibacillus populi]GGB53162.1 transcription antiterminator LicT [Lentibacillus populi]
MKNSKMKIKQILNNNAVIATDKNQKEVIAIGKGIGFKYHSNDWLDEADAIKVYVPMNSSYREKIIPLLEEIPFDCITLTEKIIDYAEKTLKVTLNQNLIINLADHINFSIRKFKEGMDLSNIFTEDIKRFYSDVYSVGVHAVKMINDFYHVNMNGDEAASIAFHIIDAMGNSTTEDTFKIITGVNDIVEIIEHHLNLSFDENSLDYSRFIIHLQFFMKKIYLEDNKNSSSYSSFTLQLNEQKYADIDECIGKVNKYTSKKHNYQLTGDDKLYLKIHIIRLVKHYLLS